MKDKITFPRLIALCSGLHPHADLITCDDLKGRGTILGDIAVLPKCLSSWHLSLDKSQLSGREYSQYLESVVMWEEACKNPALESFSVAATTFIAGKSSSTFDLAWHLYKRNIIGEWGGVIAASQTSGRGQMQRPWFSPRGNLYVSFVLPTHPLLQGDAASVVLGLLLVQAFKSMGYNLQLKWPNDILNLQGQKVAGLLLEERDGILMAGLGVNLRDIPSPSELRDGTATLAGVLLKDEGQEVYVPPFFVWQALQKSMLEIFQTNWQAKSLSCVLAEANQFIAWRGRRVFLDNHTSGLCLGFGVNGGILLALENGTNAEFLCGSLSLERKIS